MSEIKEAYENGKRIRMKSWPIYHWVKKFNKYTSIAENNHLYNMDWSIISKPELWEIWHEDLTPKPSFIQRIKNYF